MNTELLGKLGDIGLSCLIIMVLILGAVLITPKLALMTVPPFVVAFFRA